MFKPLAASALVLSSRPAAPEARLLFTFRALEPASRFSAPLPRGLRVIVVRTGTGWAVGVFKGSGIDNLLHPTPRWHGAYPCQLSAWSHLDKTFPDIRVLPVRGSRGRLVVDLSSAVSEGPAESGDRGPRPGVPDHGAPPHARFVGGVISIGWRPGP